MRDTTKALLGLTAADLMSRDVVTIHHKMSLQEAAGVLHQADVTGAPVVDDQGRWVGVLSTVDFLRWAEKGACDATHCIRTCMYQRDGRLLNGHEAVICTLAEGACPLQSIQPTTSGRRSLVCLSPHDVLSDWQQVIENAPDGEVSRYMTTDVVAVAPDTRLTELAQKMIDCHIHRVVIADADGKPVGVVSATDVLAAVAREESRVAGYFPGVP